MTILKFESGESFEPTDDTPITCKTHGITVKWGDLDGIQQLAVEDGIDTLDDMPCLLDPSRREKI